MVDALDQRAQLVSALVAAGRGDRRAFEDVYRRTSAKLLGICLRIFPDRHDAEDALQDAFVTIWAKASAFDATRASPITWLATITRNRAIDRLRARGKAVIAPVDEAEAIADPSPSAEMALMAAGEGRALASCVETLDARDAAFIRAAFVGGATYAELAETDNVPLGTVKSRIRRALIKLRACLEGAA
jgi:RNA polymerase sigma-70 factor, ECF subfamily